MKLTGPGNGVRPDEMSMLPWQSHQHRLASAAWSRGQDRDPYPNRVALTLEGGKMLAGEDLGRGEHRRLRAGLDRFEHRQQGDQRLARADIALEQAQHRPLLRHVPADVADDARLGTGELVGQLELRNDPAIALERHAALAPRNLAQQQQRQLVGENSSYDSLLRAFLLRIRMDFASASASRPCCGRKTARSIRQAQARARARSMRARACACSKFLR